MTSVQSPTSHRLPGAVRPVHYALRLQPDLGAFTFQGHVEIALDVAEEVNSITANAAELTIDSAAVVLPNGETLAARASLDEASERVTIHTERPVPMGQATLRLDFQGTLNDQLRGFYRSRYTGADGVERWLATTQFEATDARRAFPCWDEPNVKASFAVTLVIPEGLTAISNMPIAEESTAEGGAKAVAFQSTPPMSTYYLAFLVGDFVAVEQTDAGGVLHRIWATRGKEEQGRFALDHSVRLLEYLNGYFGTPYPLPKLDHIAVPDFAAGAMENWGCITYRETALLFDPQDSAAQTRQRILQVVAHEMAHMWFGDLVTMEWWDDLWLNESFASWMGDKAVDHLYPEWEMWTQFVSDDMNSAFALDALRTSHPIEQPVNDPAEIRELFDAISYSKGGSVLRMLEDYLEPERFRQGLRDYIEAHAYANARGAHLWEALEKASGKPAVAIAGSWIKQTGFPVVNVDVLRGNEGVSLSLHQRRFLYDDLIGTDAPHDDATWQIPVAIAREDSLAGLPTLMDEREMTLGLDPSGSPTDWIKVNAGQTSFFRANYGEDEWERLRHAVDASELPPPDRLGLQSDAYALMRAGHLPATVFLSLARAYDGENEATVLGDLASNLRGVQVLLSDQPFIDAFDAFARDRFAQAAARAGWDAAPGEGHLDALYRATALGQYGGYGATATVAEAAARFNAYASEGAALHPDIRSIAYALAALDGDRETYETMWRLYGEADLHEEKMRLLGAMTNFKRQDLLSDLLERAMNPEIVRSQDTVLVLVRAGMNRHARDLTWEFIKEHWEELDRRYGKGGFAIMRLVEVSGRFTTSARAEEVKAFFDANPVPSAARTVQQCLERIRLNEAWVARNAAPLEAWLASAAS